MPFVPVPNCVEVQVRGTLDNQQVENTLSFESATAPTAAEIAALADSVETWFGNGILPHLSNQYLYRETYAVDLSEQTGPTATAAGFSPAAGGSVDTSAPNAVALCISFRTNGRGRSFRGRNYVSGLPKGSVTGNYVSSTLADQLVDGYNQLIGGVALPPQWTWVVVSRRANKVDRVTGIATPVTKALYVDLVVDSQRRRTPGRGN